MSSEFLRSAPGAEPLVLEADFAAPVARVFRAFTVPDEVKRWFGPRPNSLFSARIDLRRGGRWEFVERRDATGAAWFEGEYLEIRPEERLAFSWARFVERTDGAIESTPVSQVEIDFSATSLGTRIRITHSRIAATKERQGFAAGWSRGLAQLTAALT